MMFNRSRCVFIGHLVQMSLHLSLKERQSGSFAQVYGQKNPSVEWIRFVVFLCQEISTQAIPEKTKKRFRTSLCREAENNQIKIVG